MSDWRVGRLLLVVLLQLAGARGAANGFPPLPPIGYYCTADGKKCCREKHDDCDKCKSNKVQTPSMVYGCNGERTAAADRLLPWGHTGAYGNSRPRPILSSMNVKKAFGAKGDGRTDDTAAFETALKSIARGTALYVPAGVYKLSRKLSWLGGIVLRGDGPSKTVLQFTRSLADINRVSTNWRSPYTWGSPGLIEIIGFEDFSDKQKLANVKKDIKFGDNKIYITNTAGFSVNMVVRIVADDVNGDLSKALYKGSMPPPGRLRGRRRLLRYPVVVTFVGADYIKIASPFPVPVKASLKAGVFPVNDSKMIAASGVQDLKIEMKWQAFTYGKERGWNAIYCWNIFNSWISNVEIVNADTGISLVNSGFVTINDVLLRTTKPRGSSVSGAYGIVQASSQANMMYNIRIDTKFVGDLAFDGGIVNLLSNVRGVDLSLDLRKDGGMFGTMFSDLNIGAGKRFWSTKVKGQIAAYNSFWAVKPSKGGLAPPADCLGPFMTFIATAFNSKPPRGCNVFVEQLYNVYPPNVGDALQNAGGGNGPRVFAQSGSPVGCDPKTGSTCSFTSGTDLKKCPSGAPFASTMWGCNADLFKSDNRLGNFAAAGYKLGTAAVPTVRVTANVKTFGAKGDCKTDDSAAFNRAIKAMKPGALLIPAGCYLIGRQVNVKSHVILRGAGVDKTRFYFPRPLSQVLNKYVGGGTSPVSYGPGFIQFLGWGRLVDSALLTRITQVSKRGDRKITLSDVSKIKKGQRIRLAQDDQGGALIRYLFDGKVDPYKAAPGIVNYRSVTVLNAFVAEVNKKSKTVTLTRPLNTDVRPAWNARVYKWDPIVSEAGVTDITFDFPLTPYAGHFREKGYNGLYVSNCFDCYFQRLRFRNADTAIIAYTSSCTFSDIQILSGYRKNVNAGHFGVQLAFGNDNLFERMVINNTYVHDISTYGTASGNVFHSVKLQDGVIDFHRTSPYANLYTDIDMGLGSVGRGFQVGGIPFSGPGAAGWTTFWNVRATNPMLQPSAGALFGALQNFIGVGFGQGIPNNGMNWVAQGTAKSGVKIVPSNIYLTQKRRLKN